MSTTTAQLFEAAITHAWNSIVITDADADADAAAGYRVQFANPAFCQMTGYALEELQGRTLKLLQGPQTEPAVIERLRACLKESRYFEGATTNYRKDGTPYFVRWNISPVRDGEGVLTHFVSIQQDISEYVKSQERTRLLSRALDASDEPIMVTDREHRIVFANSAFSEVTGYSPQDLQGQKPTLLHSGEHDEAFYQEVYRLLDAGEAYRSTFINRRRDGTHYHAEQTISPIKDDEGRITHYVCVSKDISDRVAQEQALRRAAHQDKLTGLHNRRYGEQLLHSACGQARDGQLSILVCDIDHFKQVNDRFGHAAGDRVLRLVAGALRGAVRSNDPVIRWGGEEFLILLERCSQDRALALAQRVRSLVEALQDPEVGTVTVSVGVAGFAQAESAEQFFARADAALYAAKDKGRNRVEMAGPAAKIS